VSPIGRGCAIGAVVLAVITVATWNRGEQEATAVAPTAPVADGSQLFRAKGCATCHDGPGVRAQYIDFPSLADAPSWASDRRDGLSAEQYIAESIREPGAFISPAWTGGGATTAMPQLGLSDSEIDAIVGYLLGADG
jgi:mono/diheme cytochrome c family protein